MKELIRYEIKKVAMHKTIVIFLIISSIFSIGSIVSTYNFNGYFATQFKEYKQLYEAYYERYQGKITNEKVDELVTFYTPIREKVADLTTITTMDNEDSLTGNYYIDNDFIYALFYKPIKYNSLYETFSKDICSTAVNNMEFYENHGNQYEYLKNRYIVNIFSNRKIEEFQNIEMFEYYIYHDFSIYILLLFCIYIATNIICIEKETQMDRLQITCKNGGKKTYIGKICAVAIVAFFLAIYLFLVDIVTFSIVYKGIDGLHMPLYSLQAFKYTPFKGTFFEYALVSAGFKFLGCIMVTLLFMIVAMLCKNHIVSFVMNLILSGVGLYLVNMNFGTNHIGYKVVNPYMLLFNRSFFIRTEFVEVFGNPVLSYDMAFYIGIISVLVCSFCITMLPKKYS